MARGDAAIAARRWGSATLGSSLRFAFGRAPPAPTRGSDLGINKSKSSIYGHLRTPVRGRKADAKRSTLHATTHEPIRRLVNSAETEDVGDDHAVAMGFKEVEPVDSLAGTCFWDFLRTRLRAHALTQVEPAASASGTRSGRAGGDAEWDTGAWQALEQCYEPRRLRASAWQGWESPTHLCGGKPDPPMLSLGVIIQVTSCEGRAGPRCTVSTEPRNIPSDRTSN